MKEYHLNLQWQVFASAHELPSAEAELLQEAKKALTKSYSPYSNFRVAAAIRLSNGEVLSGANYENASYPMCLCAERVALAAAAALYPGVAIEAMAITVQNPSKPVLQPAAPCGACRQVMVETEGKSGQNMQVLLQGEEGTVFLFSSAKTFLPLYFDSAYLQ